MCLANIGPVPFSVPDHNGAGDPHAHDWDWDNWDPATKPDTARQPGRPIGANETPPVAKYVAGGIIGIGTGYLIYQIVKDAVAVAGAPETGGASLGLFFVP
jgi:hypothetical protein